MCNIYDKTQILEQVGLNSTQGDHSCNFIMKHVFEIPDKVLIN